MLKRNWLFALRKISNNKILSFLTIIGLLLGISSALVIYLIVAYDFSFERNHRDGDRIFRIVSTSTIGHESINSYGVPMPLFNAIKSDISGIDQICHFRIYSEKVNVQLSDNNGMQKTFLSQSKICFADSSYFNFFTTNWLAGSPQTALSSPFSVVLTESRAKLYFPHTSPDLLIGEKFIYNDSIEVTIKGILKDIVENSDFQFQEFISYETILKSRLKDEFFADKWTVSSNEQLFIKKVGNALPASIESQLNKLAKFQGEEGELSSTFHLQALNDIHFKGMFGNFERQADKSTLFSLSLIGLIMLLLACINCINLTIAQALQRTKEIGVRKSMGASRKQLVFLFLTETFCLTLFATVLSLILLPFILKALSPFVYFTVSIANVWQLNIITCSLFLILPVTLISGLYPSWVLATTNPALTLRNRLSSSTKTPAKSVVRSFLTVTQFVFAQSFILATIFVAQQNYYIRHKDLGFLKEGVINLSLPYQDTSKLKRFSFLNELQKIPQIEDIILAGNPPSTNYSTVKVMRKSDGQKMSVEVKYSDSTYFNFYKIKVIAGRLPNNDSLNEYIVNQRVVLLN